MTNKEMDKVLADYVVPRGMSLAKAKKRGMKILTPTETNKLCKRNQYSIFIPYFDLSGNNIKYESKAYGRLRLIAKKMFGKLIQPKPKFMQMNRAPNMFYLDKAFKRWRMYTKDVNRSIIITEGEIKGAVAIEYGFPCIALGGVWSWRTKINGATQPIPDFDSWGWGKRVVYTCFDSDAINNPQVQHALMELSYELKRRGADVRNIVLPTGKDESKLGLDDYLKLHGAKNFRALIEKAEHVSTEPAIREMNKHYAFITMGGKEAILRENENYGDDIILPSFELFTEKSMKSYFCNKTKIKIGKDEKPINIFDYWRNHPARREYKGITFNPDYDIPNYYNLWKGFICEPKKGKWNLYKKHIFENICSGDKDNFDYTIAWMADAVQNISKKPGVAYVLRGKKGTGKGVFVNHFGALFGSHFGAFYQSRHITGNFNAHLKDKLLVFADEAFWAGDKQGEGALKGMITEPTMSIEFKHKDTFEVRNMVRLMVAGNPEWVVPASDDERRYFVVNVSNKHKQDHLYFEIIEEQMNTGGYEALLYYLLNYNLSGINLRDVPVTEALVEQKQLTMDSFYQWWEQKLTDGWLVDVRGGWGNCCIRSDTIYEQYLAYVNDIKERHPLNARWFGKRLNEIVQGERERRYMTIQNKRVWGYRLPTLKKCRAYFDGFLGADREW